MTVEHGLCYAGCKVQRARSFFPARHQIQIKPLLPQNCSVTGFQTWDTATISILSCKLRNRAYDCITESAFAVIIAVQSPHYNCPRRTCHPLVLSRLFLLFHFSFLFYFSILFYFSFFIYKILYLFLILALFFYSWSISLS